MKFIDLTGKRFGKLVVVSRAENKGKKPRWNCICDCSGTTIAHRSSLVSGKSKSCGCNRGEAHQKTDSPEYYIWCSMKQRCTNPNDRAFHNYGGRGIKICDRWLNSFEAFLEDMGERPSKDHSIDRIDNEFGHYCPENCRWTKWIEQQNNRRDNRNITYKGKTLTIAEWARRTGNPYMLIYKRLYRGWPVERALTEPVRHKRSPE